MEAFWTSTGFLQLLRVWVRGSQWSGPKEWGGRGLARLGAKDFIPTIVGIGMGRLWV